MMLCASELKMGLYCELSPKQLARKYQIPKEKAKRILRGSRWRTKRIMTKPYRPVTPLG